MIEEVWYGKSPGAAAARAALLPLSSLFGAGARLRGLLYDRQILRTRQAPAPVISVGGLSVGGSGKTPVAIWLARQLHAAGLRPCLVTRGYGGTGAARPLLVKPDDAATAVVVERAGDEAALLALRTRCAVAVAADRASACEHAFRELSATGAAPDVFVLDDGFQHRALARDLDVVVTGIRDRDAALLPAGPLREPFSALSRADAVIEIGQGAAASRAAASPIARGRPFAAAIAPSCVVRSASEDDAGAADLASLEGRRVVAVAAIARPARFLADVESCGARVVASVLRRDHHRYDAGDCREIDAAASDADLVVTTEKDLVKLAHARLRAGVVALRVELSLAPADSERLIGLATSAIRRRDDASRARTDI